MHPHQGDTIINITLATVLFSMPWWIRVIEEFSWISGKLLLPTLGLVLVGLQIWYMVRKHKDLGGNKPE